MPRESTVSRVLPAEHAVLFMLGNDDNDGDVADALRGRVDWPALLALAHSERATGELQRRIHTLSGVRVPEDTWSALQRMAMIADFETAQLQECLRDALGVLESLDARVMLLKGAAHVCSVYGGDFRHRPMADIDLLVDSSRAPSVQAALTASRWRQTVVGDLASAYIEHHHLPPLRDARGTNARLEIHTAPFAPGHPFGLTTERLWASAERLTPGQGAVTSPARGVFIPALGHQLLHVCLHFAWSHVMRFGAWRTFRDIRAFATSGRIDWEGFTRVAREMRAGTACYWTFRLAQTAAGVRLPPHVLDALRPPRPEWYLRGLERHYLLNLLPIRPASPSVRLDRAMWELGMLPARSGFRSVRPWDRDEQFVASARPSSPNPAGPSRQLWSTARYVSTVVGGSAREQRRNQS